MQKKQRILEQGGTCIWINSKSEITRVKVESTKKQARFIEGQITTAQIKPTQVAEFTLAQKRMSLGIACIPSRFVACPSSFNVLSASDAFHPNL